MALSYVGGLTSTFVGAASGTQTISINGTLTGGSNTSPSTNDIVIVVYTTGSTADRAIGVTTAGYTEEAELYSNGTGFDTNLSVSWKRMGTTVDTSVIVNATGNAADAGAVAIHVWRGVDTVTAMDATRTTATGTGNSRPNPAAITPVTTGAVIIVSGGGSATTGAVYTASYLSNFRTATSADTNDAMVGIGSVTWTSGAYDPAVWAGGTANAADSWAAVTLALRPWVTQTLTPSRYDNPDVFYAATITQSAPVQNLTASRYNNSNTFYSASITKTYNAVASRYNNTNTFYNATVGRGAVTLSANRFNNSNTFYAAIVSILSANQNLVANRFNNANVFYSPKIKETIYASRYNNSNTFYASTVTTANAVSVSLYSNSNTFYSVTVTVGSATQSIQPVRFNNSNVFYNAIVIREAYIPPITPFYVEGVKVNKKVKKVTEEDIIDYDEEIAILMLMAA